MMPWSTFNCPHCGAPGQVQHGVAEYTCECRLTMLLKVPQTQFQPVGVKHVWQPCCAACGQPIWFNHVCATSGTAQGE